MNIFGIVEWLYLEVNLMYWFFGILIWGVIPFMDPKHLFPWVVAIVGGIGQWYMLGGAKAQFGLTMWPILLIIVAYYILGFFASTRLWIHLVNKNMNKFLALQADFIVNRNLPADFFVKAERKENISYNGNLRDFLQQCSQEPLFKKLGRTEFCYGDMVDTICPKPKDYTTEILTWIMLWPFELMAMATNWTIDYVSQNLVGFYSKRAKSVFDKMR